MLNFIEQSSRPEASPHSPMQVNVALGCDHAGFHLKEVLKEYLHSAGIHSTDMGASSTEASDYTDYALAAGEAVAARAE